MLWRWICQKTVRKNKIVWTSKDLLRRDFLHFTFLFNISRDVIKWEFTKGRSLGYLWVYKEACQISKDSIYVLGLWKRDSMISYISKDLNIKEMANYRETRYRFFHSKMIWEVMRRSSICTPMVTNVKSFFLRYIFGSFFRRWYPISTRKEWSFWYQTHSDFFRLYIDF